jgi:hypothetical protein
MSDPIHIEGQMDLYDCIEVAQKNLDGKGPVAQAAKTDTVPGRVPHAPAGPSARRPMTPAEVVAEVLDA